MVGFCEGSELGDVEGIEEDEGLELGVMLGPKEGAPLGRDEGEELGVMLGPSEGAPEEDGMSDGDKDGSVDGVVDGNMLGIDDGGSEGLSLGNIT